MAQRLSWSPQAADELEEIVAYIARDSPRYAAHMARRITDACERVSDMPTASAIVPELDRPDFRQLIVWPYRIIFRVYVDRIGVLTIVHGARDVGAHLAHVLSD
jgi:toxin ParE1/3/4